MSRARVAVLKVITRELSVTDSAEQYGFSRRHLHRLLQRYRDGGIEAVEPQSRRPASNSRRTTAATTARVIELRTQLTGRGLDAGPVTIAWHLERAFEYVLTIVGTTQKNGHPYHPQTQGKIERFHQTLKLWLTSYPAPATIPKLQTQLDTFRTEYNEHRPHRALGRATPGEAYRATPKAQPATTPGEGHHRLRYDHVGRLGKMSFRRAGRMHHLGIGTPNAGKRVLAITDETTVTVIDLESPRVS